MGKEFNLKKETEKWTDKWVHKKLTGRAYKELRDIEKEFIKIILDEIAPSNVRFDKNCSHCKTVKNAVEIIKKRAGDWGHYYP